MAHTFLTIGSQEMLVNQSVLLTGLDLVFRLAASRASQSLKAKKYRLYADMALIADEEGPGSMYFPLNDLIRRGELGKEELLGMIEHAISELEPFSELYPKEKLIALGSPPELQYDIKQPVVLKFLQDLFNRITESLPNVAD